MSTVGTLLLINSLIIGVHTGAGTDWGYDDHNGPDNWGGDCQNNIRQSPIDIRASDVDFAPLHRLHFINYNHVGDFVLKNTGRTLMANGFDAWRNKQPMIQGGGLKHRYILAQFHLHWAANDASGSEHTFGSLHYPAELHLVHVREGLNINDALKRPDGIAVVAVFLSKTTDNNSNNITPFSDKFGDVKHMNNTTNVSQFRMSRLLPDNTEAFYRYDGSLTTPGCSEAVVWTLLAEPIAINKDQLHKLRHVHDAENRKGVANYRPVQPMHGRRVLYRPSRFNRTTICSSAASITCFSIIISFINYFL